MQEALKIRCLLAKMMNRRLVWACTALISVMTFAGFAPNREITTVQSPQYAYTLTDNISNAVKYSTVSETVYATCNVNIRTGAGTGYKRLGTLKKGSSIKRVAKGSNGWSKVIYNGKTAYICSKYLTTKASSTSKTSTSSTTKYATCNVNMRKGAGKQYSRICTLKKGTSVKVLSTGNGWSKVTYNGKTGYICSKYLTTSKPSVSAVSTTGYPKTYQDSTAKITVTKEWYKNAYCYIAHLQFSDYTRFGTACGNGKYGGYETVTHAANRLGSILTVNGCYSAPYLNYPVARSGKVYNDKACWVPAVYSNRTGLLLSAWETGGTKGITGEKLSKLIKNGKVTDTFSFGPPILVNGTVSKSSDTGRAQRTFIGTNGKAGDIYVVVSDGRYVDGKSAGLTYKECAELLKSKGCIFGVPLDGGGSSTMVFQGKILNKTSGRSVVDFVYFK